MRVMRALGLTGAAALGVAILATSAFGGCGGDAFSSGSGGDASAGDGSSSGGDDGMPGEGGDGPSMMPGQTVYVAPSGKDSNSGLDPEHPVRTIKKGVQIAQGLVDAGVVVPNVLVCSGSYPEDSLHVGFDVGLYGAYNCSTNPAMWTRAPGYGWPTFDQKVASNVSYANTTAQVATLALTGSSVTSKTSVDGFTITGGQTVTSSPGPSIGVEVALGASPVLSNLVVVGGAGSAASTDTGSMGVHLGKGSAELKFSVVDGGSGKGPAGSGFGSIGVRMDSGAPNVHDAVVAGGSGQAIGYSSIGIDVLSSLTVAGNNPLSKVIVLGADSSGAPTGATMGVAVRSGAQADLDLVDSVVYGSGATTGTLEAVGVEFDNGGKLTLLADHIGAGVNAQGKTIGVQVTSAANAAIVNCEIHAGDVPANAAGSTRGVVLSGPVTKAAIVFDTIYTGGQGGQTGTAAIDIEGGVGSVAIENDLLFGNDTGGGTGSAGAAVIAGTCAGTASQLASLDHTGFVNFADLLYCTDLGASNALPAGITAVVDGPTGCKKTCGNVLVTATCATPIPACQPDPGCPSSPPAHCIQSILGSSWSPTGDGFGSAGGDAGIQAGSWEIQSPGNYCKLTAGGVPVPGITEDLLGNKRSTTTPTMGAVEYAGPTCTM
jgi:hypothetical protein